MGSQNPTPTHAEIENRLKQVGRYSRFVRAGLGVIAVAFLLALGVVLPANLDSPEQAVQAILMPLTFVGIGLILFGIGMHLHLLHLNLVRQLQPETTEENSSETNR